MFKRTFLECTTDAIVVCSCSNFTATLADGSFYSLESLMAASRESPWFFSKTCLWARSKWACKSLYPLPLLLLNLQPDMGHGFFYGRSSVHLPFMFWISSTFFASFFWKRVTLAVQRAFLYFWALGEIMLFSNHHAINRILCKTLAEVRLPVYVLGGHG